MLMITFFQILMVMGLIYIAFGTGLFLVDTFTRVQDYFKTFSFSESGFILLGAGIVLFVGSVVIMI